MKKMKIYYVLKLINAHIPEREYRMTARRFTVEISNQTLIDIEKAVDFLKHSDAESITFEDVVIRKEDGNEYNVLFTCQVGSWGMEILNDDEKLSCKKVLFLKNNIAYLV